MPEWLIDACSSENVTHCIYLRCELITNKQTQLVHFIQQQQKREIEKKNRIDNKVINFIDSRKLNT